MLSLASVLVAALAASGPPTAGPQPSATQTPSGPASVRGLTDAATVTVATGQVGYAIPLDLPLGPGGFGPRLALTYSGSLGNGPLGVGWSLDTPRIERSTRQGVPRYAELSTGSGVVTVGGTSALTDALECVGLGASGRLVAVPGQVSYRVEGQGQRIRVDPLGSGFRVLTSDGLELRLGTTAGTRQQVGSRVFAWVVDELREPSTGQVVQFSYAQDEGQLTLADVRWGPTTPSGPAFHAQLTYESRPDHALSYREGFRVVSARRLAAIDVRSFGTLLRRYELSYASGDLPLSRLSGLVMKGLEGQGRLPPLTFDYGPENLGPASEAPVEVDGTDGWILGERGVVLLDVDGDGLSDLARFERGSRSFKRNVGARFEAPRPLPGGMLLDISDVQHVDLTADARADMVYQVDDTWRVYQLVGGQLPNPEPVTPPRGGILQGEPPPPSAPTLDTLRRWETIHYELVGTWGNTGWPVPLRSSQSALADIDGDGRTDVIVQSAEGLTLWFGAAGTFQPPVTRGVIDPLLPAIEIGRDDVRIFDVNGDGLADVVWLGDREHRVFFGRGDGTFAAEPDPRPYPWATPFVDLEHVHLVDLNRDGLLDIVRSEAGHAYLWTGTPAGFSTTSRRVARPTTASYDDVLTFGDLNGNGSQDLVWSGRNGRLWLLDLAGPAHEGQLTRVQNGLGKVTRIDYTTSSLEQLAAEDEGREWVRKLPVTVPLPKRVRVSTGIPGEPERVTEYSALDGFWDASEQRFGGFLHTTTHAPDSDPERARVTDQWREEGLDGSRVLRGRVFRERVARGDGMVFSETLSTHDAVVAGPLPSSEPLLRVPFTRKLTVNDWECQCGTPVVVETEFEPDAEGNVSVEVRKGRLDLAGDETVIHRTYASNDTTWVRGVVCSEQVKDLAGALYSHARTLYDLDEPSDTAPCPPPDPPSPAEPCSVLWGRPTQVQSWLDGTGWVTTGRAHYDTLGNATCTRSEGVWRSIAFDVEGRLPLAETLGAGSSPAFTTTYTWDSPRGLLLTTAGPNAPFGDRQGFAYDSLGRPTAVSADWDGDGSLEVITERSYPWEETAPRVETRTVGHDLGATPPERLSVEVSNGAGEPLYSATRLKSSAAPPQWLIHGHRVRDRHGRTVALANPYASTGATLPAAIPTGTAQSLISYDALGRPLSVTLPTGAMRSTSYTSFASTTTVAGLAPVTVSTDGQGRVIGEERTIADAAGVPSLETVATRFDPLGRVVERRLQGGLVVRTFGYDTLGHPSSLSDPDSGLRTYETEPETGRVVQVTNALGEKTLFDYDSLGRVTDVRGQTAGGTDVTHHRYFYDALSAACATLVGSGTPRVLGRLTGTENVLDGPVWSCIRYDPMGRPAVQGKHLFGRAVTESSLISASGKTVDSVTSEGLHLTATYDTADRLIRLDADHAGATDTLVWSATSIDAAGNLLSETTRNGVETDYERDVVGQTTRLTIGRTTTTGTLLHYDAHFEREPFGGIQRVVDLHPPATDPHRHEVELSYDGAGRLTEAWVNGFHDTPSAWGWAYTYDGLQRMTSRTQLGGPPVPALWLGAHTYGLTGQGPRQLRSVGARTLDHDAAGRVTRMDTTTLTFDPRDRVRQVAGPDLPTLAHVYDADGHRVRTSTAADEVELRFTPHVALRGSVLERMLTVGDRVVAKLATPVNSNVEPTGPPVATFFHTTFGAGPGLFTDAAGNVSRDRVTDPFGQVLGVDAYTEYTAEPWGSGNRPFDAFTGWADHGARWMSPQIARWLSPDEALFDPTQGGLAQNPYVAFQHSPLVFWDPDGRGDWLNETGWRLVGGLKVALAVGTAGVGGLLGVALAANFATEGLLEMRTGRPAESPIVQIGVSVTETLGGSRQAGATVGHLFEVALTIATARVAVGLRFGWSEVTTLRGPDIGSLSKVRDTGATLTAEVSVTSKGGALDGPSPCRTGGATRRAHHGRPGRSAFSKEPNTTLLGRQRTRQMRPFEQPTRPSTQASRSTRFTRSSSAGARPTRPTRSP